MELNVFGNDNLENTFEGLEITQRRQAMAKRGNNEGSIYKRADGRWAAVVSLPGGKRHYLYGKTRQDTARKLASAMRDRDVGLPITPERQTVAQFLSQWLEVAQPTVRNTTFVR